MGERLTGEANIAGLGGGRRGSGSGSGSSEVGAGGAESGAGEAAVDGGDPVGAVETVPTLTLMVGPSFLFS